MKKKYIKIIAAMLTVAAVITLSIGLCACSGKKNSEENQKQAQKATEKQLEEITVTPCTEEEVILFGDSLIGTWTSYASDGSLISYTFEKDGSARYQKEGEDAADYSYTLEDGIFTVKSDKKDFAYQCSKDAVGMNADHPHGQVMDFYAKQADTIPDFNGCVWIDGDFLYMGSICLCRDDKLAGFNGDVIVGDWLGVNGDNASFTADGTYTYHDGGEEFNGNYTVDPDSGTLTITLSKSTEYDENQWGIADRVLHIDQQYFFKVS